MNHPNLSRAPAEDEILLETPILRFFGSPHLGDGEHWTYLGDTPEAVAEAIGSWVLNCGPVDRDEVSIKVHYMTDSQIAALPET